MIEISNKGADYYLVLSWIVSAKRRDMLLKRHSQEEDLGLHSEFVHSEGAHSEWTYYGVTQVNYHHSEAQIFISYLLLVVFDTWFK